MSDDRLMFDERKEEGDTAWHTTSMHDVMPLVIAQIIHSTMAMWLRV